MVLYWKIWNRWPAGNWNQKQPFNPRFLEFQYSELDNHTNSLFYVFITLLSFTFYSNNKLHVIRKFKKPKIGIIFNKGTFGTVENP